jgi:hypothetical protein
MCFEDVDVLDVVFGSEDGFLLDGSNGIDDQVGEEVGISVDEFARHGGFGAVEQRLLAQSINCHSQFILDVSACLLGGDLVASDDVGGVDLHLDQFVGSFE